jgi:hypothetical protein
LLDSAIGKKKQVAPSEKKTTATADPSLPRELTMNQIRGGMRKITGAVQACYDKFGVEGQVVVKVTISPKGAVSEAEIRGKFRGTDTGNCVAAAVKRARFTPFSGPPMAGISYPFMLQ